MSFKDKFIGTGKSAFFVDVCENRGHLQPRLSYGVGLVDGHDVKVVIFHWFY